MSKERYYQYLKGEHAGEVTTLDFIDDSDPEITLFNFKDGFKCNQDFIAKINDKEAFNSPAILAEIDSPINKWIIEKHEAKPKNKKVYTKEGEQVEIADPYFFDKNGSSIHQGKPKMTAAPPKPSRVSLPDLKTFYISYTPEEEEAVEENQNLLPSPKINENPEQEVFEKKSEAIKIEKIEVPVESPHDIDLIEDDEVEYKLEDKVVKLNSKRILEEAFNKKVQEEEFNNSPISIMLKNCKKKEVELGLKIEMSLPDKSIYEVIKSNFPEGWDYSFIKKVVNDIDIDEIRKSLINSLKSFYDKEIDHQPIDNK